MDNQYWENAMEYDTARMILKELRTAVAQKKEEDEDLKEFSEHIGYVEISLSKTTTDIKNIKKYLLSALYNAPVTMESYYDAWVKHDMASGNVGF